MVRTKEAKPPQEVVDAIQEGDDMTAPASAEVLHGIGATREMAAKLVHEEPQKPSELPAELRGHGGEPMDKEEKHLKFLEAQRQQQQEQQYNRNHPGAGKAGRGDQEIDSMINVSGGARKQTGSHDQRTGEVHRG